MAEWDQIVIGRGTSALTFLHAALQGTQKAKFVHNRTLVIGKAGEQLWSKVGSFNKGHEMGQPEHLLRPSGLPPVPRMQGAHDEFLKTGDYNRMLVKLLNKTVRERRAQELPPMYGLAVQAIAIHADGGKYRVLTDDGDENSAKQVIIAGGTGPSQDLSSLKIVIDGDATRGEIAASGEYLDSVDYMTKAQKRGLRVLVYGGSASSSWAVAHAFAMEAEELMWGCRRGLDAIADEGNPVGRNTAIIEMAKANDLIEKCEITKITVLGGKTAFERRLRVHFKEGAAPRVGSPIDFDQIVYAVGADPIQALGPGGLLKGDLQTRMMPVWDNNYRFSERGRSVTALKDKSGDLWVVGAAVYRGLGVAEVSKRIGGKENFYAEVGQILCEAGRPPEGIAIIDATINAVTGYRQNDKTNFNWNKANRRDIFQLLAQVYNVEIPLSVREKIVTDIINARSATKFGINREAVKKLTEKRNLGIDLKILPGL